MADEASYVAVDLGAGSGRVVLGRFPERGLELEEIHRFPNPVRTAAGRLRWDAAYLVAAIETGLAAAAATAPANLRSVGVDTWGVDFGLLDAAGRLLEDPVCYRDPRTDGAMEAAFSRIPRAAIYDLTGIQFLPFNTLFQLSAQRALGEWPAGVARLLLMPDLMHHHLSGATVGEFTAATTTQLVNARTRTWEPALFAALDLELEVMPELVPPGTELGRLRPELARRLDLPELRVVAPAAHDTASAVAGTPLEPGWLFLSSGTWSLLGRETPAPVLSASAFAHDFTNEGGAAGRNRFLKNVMGLWILESCRREWAAVGADVDHAALAARIEAAPPLRALVCTDDLRFLNPPSMLAALAAFLHETGQPAVEEPGAVARMILESLALRYASIAERLVEVTGEAARGLHIVGGGSRNAFLNQATADAAGLPVRTGPAEATALGNLLVQAITDGRFGSLDEGRDHLRAHTSLCDFTPRPTPAWREARARYRELESRA
ncbi:MAG: rhamnulokinase [Planctomycetes bacterium]|nr:rhamnulokinase [Planctomycetota bacterium]